MADMTLDEWADHLKQVRDRYLPAAEATMLGTLGFEAETIAKDRIVGRLTPLQPVGRFPGWPPLQPSTITQKALYGLGKNGNPRSMLFATGDLHDSIKHRVIKSAHSVTLYNNNDHAAFMEYGFVNWRSRQFVGPRPFIGPAMFMACQKLYPRFRRWFVQALQGKRLT